jgi:hypothetical protein
MRADFTTASDGGKTRFSTRTDSMALMLLSPVVLWERSPLSVFALTSH